MATTPPPDFPLYGLDWNGTRALDWVCMLRRNSVNSTYGVWLAHLSHNDGIRVGSFSTATLHQEGLTVAQQGVNSLLDITMPIMNGLEVCREVRADPDLEDLPVILMTARAQASDVQAGMEAGADTYIIKPFGPIELNRKAVQRFVDEHMSGKRDHGQRLFTLLTLSIWASQVQRTDHRAQGAAMPREA